MDIGDKWCGLETWVKWSCHMINVRYMNIKYVNMFDLLVDKKSTKKMVQNM